MKKQLKHLIQSFDLYPKVDVDLSDKTTFGGFVAIFSFVLTIILFYAKLDHLIHFQKTEKFVVNTNLIPRDANGKLNESMIPKMRINFDISLFHVPCAFVYLDLLDHNKEPFENFSGKIRLQRYNSENHPIFEQYYPKDEIPEDGYCGPCYSLKSGCCNTCKEVIGLFESNNRPPPAISLIEQCRRYFQEMAEIREESCRIHGSVIVKQQPGYFIIRPGSPNDYIVDKISSNKINNIYESLNFSVNHINMTHHIHRFGFGMRINEKHSPLDGNFEVQAFEGRMKMRYYLRIVPIGTDGVSFTYSSSSIQTYRGENTTQPPIILFSYDISPIVVVWESNYSIIEIIVQLTSIIGGVFALATFVDLLLSSFFNTFSYSESLPKAE